MVRGWGLGFRGEALGVRLDAAKEADKTIEYVAQDLMGGKTPARWGAGVEGW